MISSIGLTTQLLHARLFQTVFCFAFVGNDTFISDQKLRLKAIEIEIAILHSFGNPEGRTLDYFFHASHIRHDFPYKLIPISMS